MPRKDAIRIALIGLGHVAKFQLEAIAHLPDIVLADAFDKNRETAALLPPGVRFHRTLDALLRDSDADVFMISTPNVTHFDIACRVIEAGKPAVVEKPICSTLNEMERLFEEAGRRSGFLHVALHAAFARDLLWWVQNRERFSDIGDLVGFEAGFFDPLVRDGKLAPGAQSLGGSWFDSGINALSVIGSLVDPNGLAIEEARMTKVPQIPCEQIQGLAVVSFAAASGRRHGIIDTNWTLGINRKITHLFYEEGHVVLDHSRERVEIVRNGRIWHEEDLSGPLPRLTNHYVGVFQNLRKSMERRHSNLCLAGILHRLLIAAAAWELDPSRHAQPVGFNQPEEVDKRKARISRLRRRADPGSGP